LHLRVAEVEYQKIALDAEAAGLTLSEYMRRRALGQAVVSSVDATMLRELRRQGGLLKHALVETDYVAREEAAAAYNAITALITQIAKRMQQ
jgi:hypothetical protein